MGDYVDGKCNTMIKLSNSYVCKMASTTTPQGAEKRGVRLVNNDIEHFNIMAHINKRST